MSGTDLIRLSHMRDSARETLGFIRQRTRADLDTDRMLALAIVKGTRNHRRGGRQSNTGNDGRDPATAVARNRRD